MKYQILLFLFLILHPIVIMADVIYLKDGRVLKGRILRQNLTKIEILLQDNKSIMIDKKEILRILYISDEELRQLELRRIEEQRKKLEELKRLEEERKRKEEEQRKLEEERKQLLEQQRLEELKRLEEEQRKKEEEQRLLEEEQKKLEEEQRKLEELKKQEEEKQIYELKFRQFQYQVGLGVGSFNFPLNRFNQYYNFFTDISKNSLKNYNQNIQVQIRSQPIWNWAGELHFGLAYFYKNLEIGYLGMGYYQKPNPKLIAIPDRNLFIQNSQLQYENYSENRIQQKKYTNSFNKFFLKIQTDDYLPFIWNYIFPYFEVGFIQRQFLYQTEINATLLTSVFNFSTTSFEISNLVLTNSNLKNDFHQNGISIILPFRFLMIFFSEFLFEFEYIFPLKTNLKQSIVEYNISNNNLLNYINIFSDFSGKFAANSISFIWQNLISSSIDTKSFFYVRLISSEYITKFKKTNNSVMNLIDGEKTFFNEFLLYPYNILYSKNDLLTIRENNKMFEVGIKIKTNL